MNLCSEISSGTTNSSDQTANNGGSGSWINHLTNRRPRLSSPSPSAYLAPAFNACASSSSSSKSASAQLDLDPSLLRYTRFRRPDQYEPSSVSISKMKNLPHQIFRLQDPGGGSSLSPIEFVTTLAGKTPVKVELEEDVLVMDGVLVGHSGSSRGKAHSSFSSGVSSSSGSVGSGGFMSFYKPEICRSRVESRSSRPGFKFQFAQGKEELPSGRPVKQKYDSGKHVQTAGSSMNGNKSWNIPVLVTGSPGSSTGSSEALRAGNIMRKTEESSGITPPPSEPSFFWPPTKEEEAIIQLVLYGPNRRGPLMELVPEIGESDIGGP